MGSIIFDAEENFAHWDTVHGQKCAESPSVQIPAARFYEGSPIST